MAWRLHDLVAEEELDNTTRGIVRGRSRFSDRTDVIQLFLLGDCHPDLAGGRFKIKRLREVPPWAEPADSTPLAAEQSGHAGNITADETIRDSNCSVEELLARIRAGEPPPHVMRYYDPDLPPSPPRRRKIREMFDPPLAPPVASRLSQQRARAELRKMQVLLLDVGD